MKLTPIIFIFLFLCSCDSTDEQKESIIPIETDSINLQPSDSIVIDTILYLPPIDTCQLEHYLTELGLVDIQLLDSTIHVELKYSTEDNFMKKDMYGCLNKCFIQPDVADKLVQAQAKLKERDSTLSLLLYDGVRPRSVQQYMWDLLDLPVNEKTKFVSNPAKGSLHNFGAAVDITIINTTTNKPLDMGSPYDHIGILAWPIKERDLLADSLITEEQISNRKILRRVMSKSGFFNIQTEWWHFNSCYRDSAYIKYTLIE